MYNIVTKYTHTPVAHTAPRCYEAKRNVPHEDLSRALLEWGGGL